jgi:hypothetical protein
MTRYEKVRGDLHRRLLRILHRPFPVFYCNHWMRWMHREFDKERARATPEEIQDLWNQERFEAQEFYGEREAILTKRLLASARSAQLSLEDIPIPSGQKSHWETGDFGHRYLSDRSNAALSRAIWQAKKEHWDLWLKIIGAVTGLLGASIGVLALLKK